MHRELGRGRPLDRSKLTRRFKAAGAEAGVRPVRFHDLRHTFATGPPKAVALTIQIYPHYAPSAHEVEMVNAAFAEEEPTPVEPAEIDPSTK